MLISSAQAQTTETTTEVGTALDVNAPYELSQKKMLTDTLSFLALLFVIFYFVLIRPQQKKVKAHQALTNSLRKGDKIITAGGFIATIHKLDSDHVATIELADGIHVKIARGSISDLYKEPKTVASVKAANDK